MPNGLACVCSDMFRFGFCGWWLGTGGGGVKVRRAFFEALLCIFILDFGGGGIVSIRFPEIWLAAFNITPAFFCQTAF